MAYPSTAPPPEKLPKAGFFWALGIFLVTAIAGAVLIALGISSIVDEIDDFQRIDVPADTEVRLEEGDNWVFAGADSTASADQVEVTVTAPDGTVLNVITDDFTGAETSTDGQQFSPLGFIEVEQAGTFRFVTEGPPGSTVRVGTLELGRIVGLLVGGAAVGGIGFLLAMILLIVTLVRRGSAKKRQRAAAYAGSYPGGPPSYPGAPPSYPGPPPPTYPGAPPPPG
jgi:hypothetical protein